MSTQKILVTGATGFIGSHVVQHLIARGDDPVCLARRTSNVAELEKQNCTIVYADLAADSVDMESALDGVTTVIHLAASTHAVNSRDMIEGNSRALENVLLACAELSTPSSVRNTPTPSRSSSCLITPSQICRLRPKTSNVWCK